MKGILLDKNNGLLVKVRRDANGIITGGLVVGNNAVQCAGLVLQINQGEVKSDPIIGANLFRIIRGKLNRDNIKSKITWILSRKQSIKEIERLKEEISGMQKQNTGVDIANIKASTEILIENIGNVINNLK